MVRRLIEITYQGYKINSPDVRIANIARITSKTQRIVAA